MTKHMNRVVDVVENDDGLPSALCWRGRHIALSEILDDWEEAGCWWLQEEPRWIYRVCGTDGVVYELHRQAPEGWRLYRVFD